MAGTITGIRYLKLLLGNGITSSELDTELADANNLGALTLLLDMNYYKNKLLSYGTAPYNILFGSEIAKYNFILTTAYIYNFSTSYTTKTIDFSTETVTTLSSAPDEFRGGGVNDLEPQLNWLERLTVLTTKALYKHDYIADTFTAHGSQLSNSHSGCGNFSSRTFGYGAFVAGLSSGPTYTRNMSRFDYGSQTSSSVTNVTSTNLNYFGMVDNETDAYTIGGTVTTAHGTASTAINKITKDANTTSVISATASPARLENACASSSLAGYSFGGQDTASGYLDTVVKLVFGGETTSVIAATLANTFSTGFAVSSSDKIYTGGGFNGSYQSSINELSLSDDTISTSSVSLGTPDANTYIPTSLVGGS